MIRPLSSTPPRANRRAFRAAALFLGAALALTACASPAEPQQPENSVDLALIQGEHAQTFQSFIQEGIVGLHDVFKENIGALAT